MNAKGLTKISLRWAMLLVALLLQDAISFSRSVNSVTQLSLGAQGYSFLCRLCFFVTNGLSVICVICR